MENIFDKLNQSLTKEDIANILNSFGFDASPRKNFRLRHDDKNPSASIFIHKSGIPMVKDFGGGGFVGDIFRTLKEYAGIPYKDSIKYIKNYLGIEVEENSIQEKLLRRYVKEFNFKEKENDELSTEEIENRWNKLYPLTSLNKEKLKDCISKLLPYEYFERASKDNQKEFLSRIRYSSYIDDIAVKALRPDNKILAYKYRRWKTKDGEIIKWKALKGSPANRYSQIRIINPYEPVFIVEGYHDYINAILFNINFIAIPYKHYKDFKEEELNLLKGNKYNFILIQDYDFDETDKEKLEQKIKDSKNQAINLNKALSPFSNNEKIFVWDNIREKFKKSIKEIDKVKDFSDLVTYFSLKDPNLFKRLLLYIANQTIQTKNKNIQKKNLKNFSNKTNSIKF